jgi:hypothetical protein
MNLGYHHHHAEQVGLTLTARAFVREFLGSVLDPD